MDLDNSQRHESTESEQNIKPQLMIEDVIDILKTFYGFEGGTVTQMNAYDDLNYHCMTPSINRNPHINVLWPHGYVLKVINTKDSQNSKMQEAQSCLMLFLRKNDIMGSVPVKNVSGNYFSVEKLPLNDKIGRKQCIHVVKLLEFQPGTLLKHVTPNFFIYYQLGVKAAKLNDASKKFYHSAYEKHESIWHLTMLPKVKAFTNAVKDACVKEIVENTIEGFIRDVVPKMSSVTKQIIHGDLNSQNIICQEENGEWKISSIIDYGDSHLSYPLYELAISMCYTMLDCKEKNLDCYIGSGHTLAGYLKVNNTIDIDYVLLKQCISARLCQSYVLGLFNSLQQPENVYILEHLEVTCQLLTNIYKTPTSFLKEIWQKTVDSLIT